MLKPITKMYRITVPIEAYRLKAMFKCDILCSILERCCGRNAGKKATECSRIVGFNSPSCQFIFNAL